MSYCLLENGTDRILLQDSSGLLLLDGVLNLNQTLGAITLSSGASDPIGANLSETLGSITLSSTVSVSDGANLSETLGAITVTSSAVAPIGAALSETLGLISLSAAAVAPIGAALSETLGLLSISSSVTTSSPDLAANLSETLGSIVLTSDVNSGAPTPTGGDSFNPLVHRDKRRKRLPVSRLPNPVLPPEVARAFSEAAKRARTETPEQRAMVRGLELPEGGRVVEFDEADDEEALIHILANL